MNETRHPIYPEDCPQLHWLFQTYLSGDSDREEYLDEEVKQNDGPFKPKLEREMAQFLEHRPLRHDAYERTYETDFSSEEAMYGYVGQLYQWVFRGGPQPDLLTHLAD